MRKHIKRAIARCPKCRQAIFQDHPDIWCYQCGEPLPQEIKSKLMNPDTVVASSVDLVPTEIIVTELRNRAKWLRTIAATIMSGIIFFTLIGILIFLRAGYTARQETVTSTMLMEVEGVGEKLRRVRESLEKKGGPQAQTKTGSSPTNPRAPAVNANIKKEPELDTNQIIAVLQEIPSFEKTIEETTGALRHDLSENRVLVPILVSSISQRIGIIILLIFLLQILVPTYRYNIRLAAFYEARADALEIMSEIPDCPLDKLILILSPDTINFGKSIQTPTEHLLEVVKDAVKVGRPPDGIK